MLFLFVSDVQNFCNSEKSANVIEQEVDIVLPNSRRCAGPPLAPDARHFPKASGPSTKKPSTLTYFELLPFWSYATIRGMFCL